MRLWRRVVRRKIWWTWWRVQEDATEVDRVQYILCAVQLGLVHVLGATQTDLVPAVIQDVWGVVVGLCLLDDVGDFLEIVIERISV